MGPEKESRPDYIDTQFQDPGLHKFNTGEKQAKVMTLERISDVAVTWIPYNTDKGYRCFSNNRGYDTTKIGKCVCK